MVYLVSAFGQDNVSDQVARFWSRRFKNDNEYVR